mmetsp:Transcript_29959/g.82589  ORF Transcript_29959/g.82589 Transcript_29959/m.82589 type:complete len:212 (+) Transcript_29959:42-677(+)
MPCTTPLVAAGAKGEPTGTACPEAAGRGLPCTACAATAGWACAGAASACWGAEGPAVLGRVGTCGCTSEGGGALGSAAPPSMPKCLRPSATSEKPQASDGIAQAGSLTSSWSASFSLSRVTSKPSSLASMARSFASAPRVLVISAAMGSRSSSGTSDNKSAASGGARQDSARWSTAPSSPVALRSFSLRNSLNQAASSPRFASSFSLPATL